MHWWSATAGTNCECFRWRCQMAPGCAKREMDQGDGPSRGISMSLITEGRLYRKTWENLEVEKGSDLLSE